MSSTQFWEVAGVLLEYAEIVGYVDDPSTYRSTDTSTGHPEMAQKWFFFCPRDWGLRWQLKLTFWGLLGMIF